LMSHSDARPGPLVHEAGILAFGRRSRAWLAALVAFLCCLPHVLPAQQSKPTEYDVKAVYLYNFGKFVEWPPSAASSNSNTFSLCVLGNDPFGAALDRTVAGEKIAGRKAVARRISKPQEAQDCQILFISASENERLKPILQALAGRPVLTVSDMPEFCLRGGMIQFELEGNRVRFQVNLGAARSAALSLSSELLKVATAVKDSGSGE
jgi:YfiR/HmsC-like